MVTICRNIFHLDKYLTRNHPHIFDLDPVDESISKYTITLLSRLSVTNYQVISCGYFNRG